MDGHEQSRMGGISIGTGNRSVSKLRNKQGKVLLGKDLCLW